MEKYIELLTAAREEIKTLRRELVYLRHKAEAYDKLSIVIGFLPRPSMTMGEDFLWRLEKEIELLREPERTDLDGDA